MMSCRTSPTRRPGRGRARPRRGRCAWPRRASRRRAGPRGRGRARGPRSPGRPGRLAGGRARRLRRSRDLRARVAARRQSQRAGGQERGEGAVDEHPGSVSRSAARRGVRRTGPGRRTGVGQAHRRGSGSRAQAGDGPARASASALGAPPAPSSRRAPSSPRSEASSARHVGQRPAWRSTRARPRRPGCRHVVRGVRGREAVVARKAQGMAEPLGVHAGSSSGR
jgi:hypothetical protein